MNIQSTTGYGLYNSVSTLSGRSADAYAAASNSAAAAPKGTDSTSISQEARKLLAAREAAEENTVAADATTMNTDRGWIGVDLNDYFSGMDSLSFENSELPPLLLPTQKNVAALSEHISGAMSGLLAKYHIPSAPDSISYDSHGAMELPDDYPYASEFQQMLDDNPAMEKELRTVNALASHLAGMRDALAFQDEYRAASGQAEIDAVIAKYSYLFSSQRSDSDISLEFSADGRLAVKADGEDLV